MKLTHEFINRSGDIKNNFSFNTLNEYLHGMKLQYAAFPVTYANENEFINEAFGLFVEAYVKYFSKQYNIHDVEYLPTNLNVNFKGKDDSGKAMTVLSLFVNSDRDITTNADHLSSFFDASRFHYDVPVESTHNMIVISSGKKVNDSLMEKAPTIKNKVVFILLEEIEHNVNTNPEFWDTFHVAVLEQKNVCEPKVYIPRDFQIDAVHAMLKNNFGQLVMPTGTGKSIIGAEYIKIYINTVNKTPIILIKSPRIILSYQLLNVVFTHLTNAGVDAQYVNLSSGDMSEVSQEWYATMASKGMVPRDVKATTNIDDIKKTIFNCRGKVPLVISATYHSGWRLEDFSDTIPIDIEINDEAHNLVMGRFSEDFKENNLHINSRNKFFFTATPCNSPSINGRGMNNEETFGKIIFRKSYKEMIERNEILPIIIQTVDVSDYILLKNKSGAITEENKMDADFERDVAAQSLAIIKSFEAHSQILRENSSQPESISPKLLVTVDGLAKLKGIIGSSEFTQLRATGVKVMAISTELKYYNDGAVYEGYDFKEKFMKDIRMLKDEDKAIILHIDMIGEGLDVSGITSVMAFSVQGTQKLIQLLGRAMRLHDTDRKNMYAGKFYKNMDRIKMMIKPYAYFIVPMFLRDSNDLMNLVREYVKQIHAAYDWIPETIYSQSQMIGDSQVLTNTQFTAKHDDYTSINFQHDIEADALLYLQDSYMPEVSL